MFRLRLPCLGWLLSVTALTAIGQRVEFRGSGSGTLDLDPATPRSAQWLPARRPGFQNPVILGRRVIVQTDGTREPAFDQLTPGITNRKRINHRTWLLETGSAREAVDASLQLAADPAVTLARPTRRPQVRRHEPWAAIPNDPYFPRQYSLETTTASASFLPVSVDLNARAAWAYTRGEGVIIGVGDDGIEKTHPDLAANYAGPNHNFLTGAANGDPMGRSLYHGTAVAGLIAAAGNNGVGLSGVAPRAKLASWVIFDQTNTNEPDEAGFAALFGTGNQEVAVQNHSWGNPAYNFIPLGELEQLALDKAVQEGRGGRGVVFIRSAGNTRQNFTGAPTGDVNLDGYANDPRQTTVAAVRPNGRFASYSTPGASVLVAAPGGDFVGGFPGLITTDRVGSAGLITVPEPGDPTSSDYLSGSRLFVGTSGSAPLVAGVAALILSARPELRWWEVQQILALSARHVDSTDPDLQTNGAGFRVSSNTGYGIPDAGLAVRLARDWVLQAPPETVRIPVTEPRAIPDFPGVGFSDPYRQEFVVTNQLVLQHVQMEVHWTHLRGRDLKVTLTSPSGWVSTLLRSGSQSEPVPDVWTFSSVQHLGESSVGTWMLEITDTVAGEVGQVDAATLILRGRAIGDDDHDGLDDDWERAAVGSLAPQPGEDPDRDGWSYAAEQMAGRNPLTRDEPLTVNLGRSQDGRLRLSWPAAATDTFQVWKAPNLTEPLTLITNVPGRFPQSGWFLPDTSASEVFEIRRTSP